MAGEDEFMVKQFRAVADDLQSEFNDEVSYAFEGPLRQTLVELNEFFRRRMSAEMTLILVKNNGFTRYFAFS